MAKLAKRRESPAVQEKTNCRRRNSAPHIQIELSLEVQKAENFNKRRGA